MKQMKLLFIIAGLVTACNKGADPKSDYSDIKTIPKHDQGLSTQFYNLGPFSISPEGNTGFTAGVPGEVRFKINPNDPRITQFSVEPKRIPDGSTLEKIDANTYLLRWTPDPATVPRGSNNGVEVTVELRGIVVRATETRLENRATPSTEIKLFVNRRGSQPKIVELRGLHPKGEVTKVEVDKVTPLQLHVDDPVSTSRNPPSLLIEDCDDAGNGETPKESGLPYLKRQRIEHPANSSRFIYHINLDLRTNGIPYNANQDGFEICFRLSVANRITGERDSSVSGEVMSVVKAMYKPRPPTITMGSNRQVRLVSGSTVTSTFSISSEGEFGELMLDHTDLNRFPSIDEAHKATLECETVTVNGREKKNNKRCTFSWFVPSDVTGSFPLLVKAIHQVPRNGTTLKVESPAGVTFVVSKVESTTRQRPPAAPKGAAK